jgi:hypothetical protein
MTTDDLAAHYFETVRFEFERYKSLADRAVAQVSDDDLFVTLDAESNSLALIMKHVAGNLRSRWTDFLTTDGEKPDRDRDSEFETGTLTTRDAVVRHWETGWGALFASLSALKPADIEKTVTIRGEPHTVTQAAARSLAHTAYHVGQIVFLAKHLRSEQWKTLTIPRKGSREFNDRMALRTQDAERRT